MGISGRWLLNDVLGEPDKSQLSRAQSTLPRIHERSNVRSALKEWKPIHIMVREMLSSIHVATVDIFGWITGS
jgi:hypothetical protein